MIVSPRLRLIFIHIQKTGGSSIEHALRQLDPGIGSHLYEDRRHIPAREFSRMVPREVWEGGFKFAFVRNPWDRLVSWHCMCLQNPPTNAFQRAVRERHADFADFIRCAGDPDLARVRMPQADYLCDGDGALLVDFVGRFERLEEDFARLGLPASGMLPRLNTSRHDDYRRYYTDELREIVAERFARDCAHFGYSFE